MKKLRSSVLVLAMAFVLTLAGMFSVNAESETINGTATFNGSTIEADFDSGQIATAVSNMQPGDDVTFTVEYVNEYEEDTDWYMSNEVLQTLEKAASAKKVTGVGTAENGGYTYELIHTDKDGNEETLFSNSKVGGEATPGNMQGLEQATNALDEWFYIQTLGEDESGKVTLNVAFEGETEVNDYMDTSGGLEVKFAVEVASSGSDDDKDDVGDVGDDDDDNTKKSSKIKTGDSSSGLVWAAVMMVSALLLLVLAFISHRKDPEKEAGSDEGTGGDA